MNGNSALKKRPQRERLFLLPCEDTEKMNIYELGRGTNQTLNLVGSWTCRSLQIRNKWLLFKPRGLWYFCYSSLNKLRYHVRTFVNSLCLFICHLNFLFFSLPLPCHFFWPGKLLFILQDPVWMLSPLRSLQGFSKGKVNVTVYCMTAFPNR